MPRKGLGARPVWRALESPVRTARARRFPPKSCCISSAPAIGCFPVGDGWGALGRKLRIEAFSIRPLERIAPADIEFKGFLPRGGETQWVRGGVMCGTRGRRLPLIGFAVRMAPQLSGRFDVIYQGSFFGGGISSPYRNGQPCRAATADDPLEAVNLRIVERIADPDKGPPPRLSNEPRYRAAPRLAIALRLAVPEPHPLVCR
jgi:hypothetical protein